MIRITKVTMMLLLVFSLSIICSCSRKSPSDRMITADGRAVSGTLLTISERSVVFESSEITLDGDGARIYLRDNAGTYRGSVSYSDGILSVITDSGERNFPVGDVESIIWGDSSGEVAIVVDVPAEDGWVRTGMEVTEDEILSIIATGFVTMETGSCGPAGIEMFSTTIALVPGATHGQLVMMVGDSEPVAAGSTWVGPSPGSGELLLAVNTPDRESAEHSGGVYSVTVLKTAGPGSGSAVIYPAKR